MFLSREMLTAMTLMVVFSVTFAFQTRSSFHHPTSSFQSSSPSSAFSRRGPRCSTINNDSEVNQQQQEGSSNDEEEGPLPPDTVSEPVFPDFVYILPDADAVGRRIRNIVKEAAKEAINERGHFSLAIPGGSILKMLVSSDDDDDFVQEDWTSKTTIAYVNHKCCDMDDAQLATHAKARNLFLDTWTGANTLVLQGTDNAPQEAEQYEAVLQALSDDILPKSLPAGLPVFDLALIGVGDDGHIGSLYPHRPELTVGPKGPWVLPVEMKSPPSITLSGPVMAAARQVVVAACGVSDKYPQGKSDGMRRAIAEPNANVQDFPAVGLRLKAKWIVDEAAASKLGEEYAHRRE